MFARVLMWLVYVALFAPLLTVTVYSFLEPLPGGGQVFSTRYYEQLFQNESIAAALWRSFVVASFVAVIAGVIGALGAFAIERGRLPGFALLRGLTLLPLAMPELVLGLSSLLWFVLLQMTLGLHSMVMAHVTFAVSYVVVTVRGRLAEFDRSLEEAAADLGCGFWRTLWLVILPNVWPAVAAGMMMAFVISFDDFLISFFTVGIGSDTLPLKLYSMIRFGLSREMYALSAILVLLTVFAVAGSRRVRRFSPGFSLAKLDN